jgi:GT2 family glycosyltransferase
MRLAQVAEYPAVRLYALRSGQPWGVLDLPSYGEPVDGPRLRNAVAEFAAAKLWREERARAQKFIARAIDRQDPVDLAELFQRPDAAPLGPEQKASVIVATYDRPADLRRCLESLFAQSTRRPVEIVVVDNHPTSGLTAPVIAEFPGTVLVTEPRQGLAYARNRGFAASTGEILVATDDDVVFPAGWLERLLAPFRDPKVMIVTGNVLPETLATQAQRLFEVYGGLGKGFEPFSVDEGWFRSFRRRAVPTWDLGATANAAFRASIFAHPRVGLMDEALGPGMPSGVGEDTYLFYRVLKAGFRLVYEPGAYVWHRHRRELPALRRQLYGYSKGHVAYHLTTLLRDGDGRALRRLLMELPRGDLHQLWQRCRGRSDYPLSLTWTEIAGHLVGPWALMLSRWRVKREGCSEPYIVPSRRDRYPSGTEHAARSTPRSPIASPGNR